MSAKRPRRQRNNPKSLAVRPIPADIDLDEAAARCRYVGSPYHKDRPSFAGMPKQRKPAASICPTHLADSRETVESWLREAVRRGNTGRWDSENRYPLEVFHTADGVRYMAVTDTNGSGEYHGFPLED